MADNPSSSEQAPLSIEQVLHEEAVALRSERIRAAERPAPRLGDQDVQKARTLLNADAHEDDIPGDEADRREAFYRWLNSLHRAALCCSGGGIRSATFCLGVIQALASHDVTHDPENVVSAGAQIPLPPAKPETKHAARPGAAENSLLGRFHFLSTVSGGGYVGSWLSSWRMHDDFDAIVGNLTGRPEGADVEPPEISWLRAYSNYLTPRIGIGSADTWAAVAIVVRNLLLNWLIIIPVVCCVLLALKMIAALSVWAAHSDYDIWLMRAILALGILFLIAAQAFTTRQRPPRRPDAEATQPAENLSDEEVKCILCRRRGLPENCCFYSRKGTPDRRAWPHRATIDDRCFIVRDLIWASLSAIAVTIFFASHYFSGLLARLPDGKILGLTTKFELPLLTAAAGFAIYAVGWIVGRPKFDGRDWILWAVSGLIYGALIGLGAYLFALLDPASCPGVTSKCLAPLLVAIIFGVPWVLLSQLVADTVFVGLVSYEALSDADREWLGRAAGWLAAFAIGWAILAFLVFAGGYYLQDAVDALHKTIIAAGGISGIVTALLGKSALTPATSSSAGQNSRTALASNVVLAIAGPIFAAVLIVVLSVALDKLLLGNSLIALLLKVPPPMGTIVIWLALGGGIAWAIARIASSCFNINRFSLHALYRNRLIRAYLGASRQKRYPDNFTGLDDNDNVRMHELWPPKRGGSVHSKSLFHVVNIALNVVSTKRLAWQERKAESFTATPLHCGNADLGFRRSKWYCDGPPNAEAAADPNRHFGIALGTAMAISGAAVSPNMGYHSSPSLSLLLTLFNVRLGWWLGNPGEAGNKEDAFRREGPRLAAKPLFYEAFGQTTDSSAYVYLSDGGHFENLGLYEMVRRRCRFIVVIDAGCDPTFAFDDLGNAVRKIYIDLGVRIDLEALDALRNRPTDTEIKAAGAAGIPYYAIGTIRYVDADGNPGGDRRVGDGYILYIKPAFHGDEAAGILAYAKANKDFPHEMTADQWFTESQFESYRSLGFEIATDILGRDIVLDEASGLTLHDLLRGLEAPQTIAA